MKGHIPPRKARDLLSAAAVRYAGERMLADALDDRCEHWRIDLDRLDAVADFVADTTREAYPTLAIPFHARWRHFEVGGVDRWGETGKARSWRDPLARARAAYDLAIVSVLLDAGSGGRWNFREPATDLVFSSSEGLGVASFALVASGALSEDPSDPWRADAARLSSFKEDALAAAFQIREDNPLAGISGRAMLMRRLGEVAQARPDLFALADRPRPGGLADSIAARASGGAIRAADMLEIVLEAFGTIWQGRLLLDGVPLGDAWVYERWKPASSLQATPQAIVPLHKLSQWLTYSLIEPTRAMGIDVIEIDGLTGLAEYRNGGLFVDLGALSLKTPELAARPHEASSPLIVEWRALTVALIDRLAPLVRARLGVSTEALPLARLLEGGTWAAGRRIARMLRPDGRPPIAIVSDGQTF